MSRPKVKGPRKMTSAAGEYGEAESPPITERGGGNGPSSVDATTASVGGKGGAGRKPRKRGRNK